jgi:hypothetical protein
MFQDSAVFAGDPFLKTLERRGATYFPLTPAAEITMVYKYKFISGICASFYFDSKDIVAEFKYDD